MSIRHRTAIVLLSILLAGLVAAYVYFAGESTQGTISPTVTLTARATTTPTPIALHPSPTATALPAGLTPRPIAAPVRLAWFYKPPQDNDLALLARRFDIFVLTKLDEPVRDLLKASGRSTVLQYLRFDAVHIPSTCKAQPYRNQVADRRGDYCSILEQHPDWLLRNPSGSLIVERIDGAEYVMTDPANAGWREFWLARARQSQQELGWNGVFLDNVGATRTKFQRLGSPPVLYADDASYQAAVEQFLQYLSSGYFGRDARPLYANIIDVEDSAVWLRYLAYLDGVMEEGFAAGWSDEYLTPLEWQEQAARIEQAQALGKQVILVSQGARDDAAREQFAFASYLLVNNGRAFFRYANSRAYDEVWLYDNYQLDLGPALGGRYRNGALWQRDFGKGQVTVDPATHRATITIY